MTAQRPPDGGHGTDPDGAAAARTADDSGVDELIEYRPAEHRFVAIRDGEEISHVEYVPRNGVWVFTHTYTEPSARHHGMAAKVVAAAMDGARQAGVGVWPVCPYVVTFLDRHPRYGDLVSAPGRR